MNYIKHLSGFFEKVVREYDFNPTHISLYIAMFQAWNQNRFANPISISRDDLMRISKISSKATYHKCVKDLVDKGYIIYNPSFNPYRSSTVEIINLEIYTKPLTRKLTQQLKNEHAIEQVAEKDLNEHCTSTEQVYIETNISNNTNIENDINSKKIEIQKLNFQPDFTEPHKPKKKLREKKRYNPNDIPPEIEDVKNYFREKSIDSNEAERFFNYYASKGWLVGGKSKMKDWRASANNWIINLDKFNPKAAKPGTTSEPKPNHLQTQNQKDYGEPL
jgi:hypothetical protein